VSVAHRAPAVAPFDRTALGGQVVFAPGAIAQLGDRLADRGWSRVMLVVAARDAGLRERVTEVLGSRVALDWNDVRQHVPAELAERAARAAREHAVDAVVTVGGGSTTGLGKAVAVATAAPLAVVPTTYAGSEMTPIYGLTADGKKRTARDPAALPGLVVYDPELLMTLPPAVLGPSALNALAHCVEALWAPARDPLTDVLALEGARLLARHLPAAYDAADPDARGAVLLAACIAGHALGTVGTSIHHGLCHLLGGMFDLPHAETHAVVLPHAVDLVLAGEPAARARVAHALGADEDDVPGAIWDLGASVGTPYGLRALGLEHDQALRASAAAADRRLGTPAGPIDQRAAERLVLAAWAGDRPGRGGDA